ncbi:integrase [Xenorhabdus szentirmaii]|nr:integrase [Xenorhabdus szentirmaii]
MISLGTYPVITLTEARAKRDETRKLVANGINSSEFRKAEKISVANLIESTFRNIACEWYEKRKDRWAALPTQ